MQFGKALKNIGIVILRYLSVVLMFTVLLLCIVCVSSSYIYKKLLHYKESVLAEVDFDNFKYQPNLSTQIYSKQGTLLAEIYNENRKYVSYDQIPDSVKNALVSVEDRRFYEHHGVDPWGALRAVATNFKSGGKSQGASTLTQQVTRGLFLTKTKTWERKIKEMVLAMEMERHFDKHKIMEMYLNEMYLGHRAYGIEAASRTYYGKSVKDLSLDQATLLVGVFQLPSSYDPYKYPERAAKRRLAVLDSMYRDGFITEQQVNEIKDKPIVLAGEQGDSRKINNMLYPYFTSWTIQELEKKYGDKIYSAGWKIYTTIDDRAQKIAEQTATEQAKKNAKAINAKDIAIVSVNSKTGELIAMAGGGDFSTNQINMAVKPRQPGSSMKPIVYAAAMEKGVVTDSSIELDGPINIAGYSPKNDDRIFRGYITIRNALTISDNIVAVKTAQKVKPSNIIAFAKKLGVTSLTDKDMGLSMALGGLSKGISPYQMATAYGAFSNRGVLVTPHYISRIVDQKGQVIEQTAVNETQVMQTETADMMVSMMRDVVEHGTGTPARIGRPIAGKTGTTNSSKDLWFVGYTPSVSTAVWVGNSDFTTPDGGFGGTYSGKAWAKFMSEYLDGTPVENFPNNYGLTSATLYVSPDGPPRLPGQFCVNNSLDPRSEYDRPYVIKDFLIQSKYKPTETADCEPVNEGDYIKQVAQQEGGIDLLIEKGFIKELIDLGYIKQLVDKGLFDQLVKDGYKDKLVQAGYKQMLIDKGYLEPDPVITNPTPDPTPDTGTGTNTGTDPKPNPDPEPSTEPEQPPVTNPTPDPTPSDNSNNNSGNNSGNNGTGSDDGNSNGSSNSSGSNNAAGKVNKH